MNNIESEMNKMMNQYLTHTYKDKNVLKVQKHRWTKRLEKKDFKGSDLSLIHMLEFMIHQKNIYNNFIKFIMFNNSIKMPVKTGANKGLLTTGEIRKLISAHNKLSKIVIPKGTNREGLEKLIKSKGYKINHKDQRLDPQPINRPPLKIVNMPPKKEKVVKKPAEKKKEPVKYNTLTKDVIDTYGVKKPPPKKKDPYPKADDKITKEIEIEEKLGDFRELLQTTNKGNKFSPQDVTKYTALLNKCFTTLYKLYDLDKDDYDDGKKGKAPKVIVSSVLNKIPSKIIKYATQVLNVLTGEVPIPASSGVMIDLTEEPYKYFTKLIDQRFISKRAKKLKDQEDGKVAKKPADKKVSVVKPADKKVSVVKPADDSVSDVLKMYFDNNIENVKHTSLRKLLDQKKISQSMYTTLKNKRQKHNQDKKSVKKPDVKKPDVKKQEPTNTKKAKDLYETIKDRNWNEAIKRVIELQLKDKKYRVIDATIKGNKFTIFYYMDDKKIKDKSVYDIPAVKKPAVKKVSVKKESVKKPADKKPAEKKDDPRMKYEEITDMSDNRTRMLQQITQGIQTKILKNARADPSSVTSANIKTLVREISNFLTMMENDKKIRFSDKIVEKYVTQRIEYLEGDLLEIAKSK